MKLADPFFTSRTKSDSAIDGTLRDQYREMLKGLLEERFQLKAHKDSKESPVYELTVAKGGPKMQMSQGPDARPMMRMGRGELNAKGAELSMLIQMLSQQSGRTVVDKTGLTGRYDFTLKWTPELGEGGNGFGNPAEQASRAAAADGPTLFTAVEEQMGLKLNSARGKVDLLVVEKAEHPSEN